MANSYAGSRTTLLFALCLPLAVFLGAQLAYSPMQGTSRLFVLMLLGLLSVPILMNWYHPLLILTWNAAITPYFLPGSPFIWMLVAFVGVGFAVVSRFTSPEARFVPLTSINRSLIVLMIIVAVTAYLRGGVGLRAFGSAHHGGKGYLYIAGAIAGYFALTSKRLPKERVGLLVGIFFLSALTSLVPNLAYLGGRSYNVLFYLFPPAYAYEQALGDWSVSSGFSRLYGLTFASNGLYCFLLARYGLRGLFDLSRPFRLALFLAAALGCLFCGFRSFMLLFLLTIFTQFFAEKLYRPRTLIGLLGGLIVAGTLTLPFLDKMPAVVQRSISFVPARFLPVALDPEVRLSAENSSRWRLMMWSDVLPEIPQYLVVGKGYSLSPTDLTFAVESDKRGWTKYGWALVTGAYHNGGLTLLIPFGLGGVLAFGWFVIASIKYLLYNFRHGDPSLKTINTFLLAYFVARLIYYLGVFGNFFSDFFAFTGIVAFSASLNGAPAEQATEEATAEVPLEEPALAQER